MYKKIQFLWWTLGFISNDTHNIHRSSTPEKGVDRKEYTERNTAKRQQIRTFAYAQKSILAKSYLMTNCFVRKTWKVLNEIHFVSFCRISKHLAERLTYLCPTYCQFMKSSWHQFLVGCGKNIQETKNLYLNNHLLFFQVNKKSAKCHLCKNGGRFNRSVSEKIKIIDKLPLVSTFLCSVKAQIQKPLC